MQVLVTISRGIIQDVRFFYDYKEALQALSEFVRAMNVEWDDAALYDSEGLIANAKHFLNDNDRYVESKELVEELSREGDKTIFIIGNPEHCLGFMVASPDDPLGFNDPVAAVSELGQMRQDHGRHLKLYRVIPVNGPVVQKTHIEAYNADCGVEDFDYGLIEEYLIKA